MSQVTGYESVSNDLIFDIYTPLSYKQALFGTGWAGSPSLMAPTWVGDLHRRRLEAYKLLFALTHNASKHYMATNDQQAKSERREYGDPDLLVSNAVDAMVGDRQVIVVEGAANYDETLNDKPIGPGPGDDPGEPIEIDAPSLETGDAATITQEEHDENELARAAAEREEWLREWENAEGWAEKRIECEEDAVGLGDGVYLYSWSSRARRVRVQVFDPGFYFPVLDTVGTDEFPTKVHLAWEEERNTAENVRARFVRRITYELAPIGGQVDEKGKPRVVDGRAVPFNGDDYDPATGRITRVYPYAEGVTSAYTCYMTEASYALSDLEGRTVDQLDDRFADYALNEDGLPINRLDLRLDFIPIVHMPNTVASKTHFGRSMLLRLSQLLDDIQATDTDLNLASATAGTPMITLSGTQATEDFAVRPGAIINVGPNGKADVIDGSNALTALMAYRESQLERLDTTSQIPSEVIGRSKTRATTGLALALAFGPLIRLVRRMRQVRTRKYALSLKMVQRIAIAAGEAAGGLPAGPVFPAELHFGSFLPSDRAATVSEISQLLSNGAISHQTAIQMLVDTAMIEVDVAAELARRDADDVATAVELFAATGDRQAVLDYLSIDRPPVPVMPVAAPPASGQTPGPPRDAAKPGNQPPDPMPGVPAPKAPADPNARAPRRRKKR